MGKPQVDIQVDDITGRWSVDTLPMILMPQHFYLNNHYAVEAAHHGLSGVEVFRHYMRRITQRGWGQFEVLDILPEAGTAHVRLRNSAMVDEARRNSGRKLCYMFAAWLEGSLEYVAVSAGRKQTLKARELYCEAEGEHDHCLFEVGPA
jgi:hypothetical protein